MSRRSRRGTTPSPLGGGERTPGKVAGMAKVVCSDLSVEGISQPARPAAPGKGTCEPSLGVRIAFVMPFGMESSDVRV